MVCVPGRVLAPPRLTYKGGKALNPSRGSWNLMNVKFQNAASMGSNWSTILVEGRPVDPNLWRSSIAEFTKMLSEVGMTTDLPSEREKISVKNLENALTKTASDLKSKRVKFALVLLPAADSWAYNTVKKVFDLKTGIRNVCVLQSKFFDRRGQAQYMANVALKVNLKLGGRNHDLDPSKLGIIAQGKTMLVGMDVTHPSPGSSKFAPSVSAIVASVDKHLGQWPVALRVQESRKEMVDDLAPMFESRLRLWQAHNNMALPENIIIYRDGVSEGQYKLVLDKELPAIRQACTSVYPASDTKRGLPKLAIIVCGKRHTTRFYSTDNDMTEKGNPPAGTVVDRGVTGAGNADFFLQAHRPIQGTARPCHYFTIYDDIFQKAPPSGQQNCADVVQQLTHNLSYTYGRATKGVSLVPPAYYADLACTRARVYLSQLFDPSDAGSLDGSASQAGDGADQRAVEVQDDVKNSMFYV